MITRFALNYAASIIESGGVIAYPTESVYGLGCDPLNADAVYRILELKKRPVDKGLILIASEPDQLLPFIRISDEQLQRIESETSIPTTWLVTRNPDVPHWITGDHPRIAIRLTRHPVARRLCDAVGMALISTSANSSNKPPAKSVIKVRQYFSEGIDYVVPGSTGTLDRPTRIVDIDSGGLIRS